MQPAHGGSETVVEQWAAATEAASEALQRHAIGEVPADSSGGVDTGLDVSAGDSVTLLASGAAALADGSGMSLGASTMLCYRVRSGQQLAKLAASGTTFEVAAKGRLELVVNFPGAWADRAGTLDPAWPRQAAASMTTFYPRPF